MSELAALLARFSTKWISQYPTYASRISKGQTLALKGHVSPWNNHSWRVLSSNKSKTYWVEVENGFPKCSCPDFENRPVRCCHIWACALMTKVAETLEERLSPPPPLGCVLSARPLQPPVITKTTTPERTLTELS